MSGEECIELMRKVLEKYEKREREIEKRLEECKKRREELRSKEDGTEPKISITMSAEELGDRREKARARNKQLLQDLRNARAVLRTESIYSPNEEELRELAAVYRSSLEK